MTEVFTFLSENIELVFGALIALLTLGVAIAKFTKTPKDDAILGKLLSMVQSFSGAVRKKPKA